MKTIIAGSRTHTRIADVIDAIHKSGFDITMVISGGAKGVDDIGEWLAAAYLDLGTAIRFEADWERYGKSAGPIRNSQMARFADALIAVWDSKSPGTKDMIDQATQRGLKVYIHYV